MEFITLDTITTDLLNIIRGANVSSSEPISKRQLEEWVHEYRALLLKRDMDKGKVPNPDYIQEINQLRLEAVDLAGEDVTSFGIETGYFMFKSTLEVPKTLDLNFKSGFMYIGTPAGDELQFVPESRIRWQRYKKYTMDDPLVFLRNGHLYAKHSEPIEYLTIRGIFEIPSEVSRFINPITNQPYFDLSSKYPIPANMVPTLKEMILQKEMGMESQAFSDITNDAAHGVSAPTPDIKYTQYNRG